MAEPRITLRKSQTRRSGDNCTFNLLGVSLEEYEKNIERILLEYFKTVVNVDFPRMLQDSKCIRSK